MTAASAASAPLWSGGPQVGPLALGGAPFGGLYESMSVEQVTSVVDAAWEVGVRYFDTAPRYGDGVSEKLLGQALAGRPREDYILSTKVGWLLRDGGSVPDFSADGVCRSLDESLTRLGTDRIDLVYLHDPDEFGDQALAAAHPALVELRDQGVVGAIGLGVNWPAFPSWFVQRADVDIVLLAGRYTLLDRSAQDELLPLCVDNDVTVVAAAVFNSGILADPSPGARYDYATADEATLGRALQLQQLCRDHGVELPAAALGWPLRHPAVSCVLVGASHSAEIVINRKLLDLDIPENLWTALDDQPI